MEKKKILLVAVSVGIFLVVVIGAVIVLSPGKPEPALMAGMERPIAALPPGGVSSQERPQPATVDAADMIRSSEDVPGLQPAPGGTSVTQDNVFYFYGENPSQPAAVERVAGTADASATTVIHIAPPPSAAVPDAPPPAPRASSPAPSPKPAPAAAAPAPKPAPAAAAAKPAPAPTKLYTDYWVQTGAFSTKARADGAKDALSAKGISSIIDVRDVENKTYYRVRIGPYTTADEADFWLGLVKSIDGFADSQVRVSQAQR